MTRLTDPVKVLHAAPSAYVPAGARTSREGFARVVTPASLVRLAPDEAVPAGTFAGRYGWEGLTLFETDDGLFHPLRRPTAHGVANVREPEFLAALERDVWSSLDMHPWHLAGTPLSPWRCGLPKWQGNVDPDEVRSFESDGRARASADLLRFLSRDVRLHGGGVLIRCRGPYAHHAGGAAYRVRPDIGGRFGEAPSAHALPMLVPPQEAGPLHEFLCEEGSVGRRALVKSAYLIDDDGKRMAEDGFLAEAGNVHGYERDVEHAAVLVAPMVVGEAASGDLSRADVDVARRDNLLAEATGLARTLRCGQPTAGEAEAMVSLAREAFGAVAAAEPNAWQGTMLRYLDRFVVPRFEVRDRQAEAELASLGP